MTTVTRAAATTVLAGLIGLGVAAGPASAADKDCPDFATQQLAQAYFDAHGGSRTNNVDRLDRDHDGIACENNRSSGSGTSAGTTSGTTSATPSGGAATGGGGSQGDSTTLLGGGSALVALGGLMFGLRRRVRSGAAA